jgi:PilX N-terminal
MVGRKRRDMQRQATTDKAPAPVYLAGNESGMVLVVTVVLLALLTILGALALDTSSTDLKIAGNSRNTQDVFYSADAALACAVNPDTLTRAFAYTAATGGSAKLSQVISIGTFTVNTNIVFMGSGPLPVGAIYDGDLDVNGQTRFHGLYFAVTTDGAAAHNAAVAVESAVVQVVGN